jgi:hypothetical protein
VPSHRRFLLVGLHTCGDLSPTLLRLAATSAQHLRRQGAVSGAESASAAAGATCVGVVSVGCCYHRVTEALPGEARLDLTLKALQVGASEDQLPQQADSPQADSQQADSQQADSQQAATSTATAPEAYPASQFHPGKGGRSWRSIGDPPAVWRSAGDPPEIRRRSVGDPPEIRRRSAGDPPAVSAPPQPPPSQPPRSQPPPLQPPPPSQPPPEQEKLEASNYEREKYEAERAFRAAHPELNNLPMSAYCRRLGLQLGEVALHLSLQAVWRWPVRDSPLLSAC